MPSVHENPSFTRAHTTSAYPECDIAHDTDPYVRQAFRRALRLMERGIAVLIQGETGTGKDYEPDHKRKEHIAKKRTHHLTIFF